MNFDSKKNPPYVAHEETEKTGEDQGGKNDPVPNEYAANESTISPQVDEQEPRDEGGDEIRDYVPGDGEEEDARRGIFRGRDKTKEPLQV